METITVHHIIPLFIQVTATQDLLVMIIKVNACTNSSRTTKIFTIKTLNQKFYQVKKNPVDKNILVLTTR